MFETLKNNLVHHEVGHWIVARALGFEVGEIEIRISNTMLERYYASGSAHIHLHPRLDSLNSIEDYLRKRIAVKCAGVTAQMSVDTRDVDTIWENDAADDRSNCDELIFVLRGIRFPEDNNADSEISQKRSIYSEVCDLAKLTIENNVEDFKAVVSYILQKVRSTNISYRFSCEELNNMLSTKQV